MILRSPLMSGKKIALMSGCAHEREPLMISICRGGGGEVVPQNARTEAY
jgi:hypothetical protein